MEDTHAHTHANTHPNTHIHMHAHTHMHAHIHAYEQAHTHLLPNIALWNESIIPMDDLVETRSDKEGDVSDEG